MGAPFNSHWKLGLSVDFAVIKMEPPTQTVWVPVGLILASGVLAVVIFTTDLGLGQPNDLNFMS